MAARWQQIAVGGVVAFAACSESGPTPSRASNHASEPAAQYASVVLERVEELPAAIAGASGTAAFTVSCARVLRDPRDGRELLLMHSQITTSTTKQDTTAVTRLTHATGDYALMSDTVPGRGRSSKLRVDCVSGRALGWVTPEA